MEITKEVLQKRLAALEDAKDQALANVNAYEGAIVECRYWMAHLDKIQSQKAEADKDTAVLKKVD